MPNYTYLNNETGEEIDVQMSISEWEEFLKENPHCQWLPKKGLGTVDPVRIGRKKPDEGFRDLLKTIKKGNIGSNINTF